MVERTRWKAMGTGNELEKSERIVMRICRCLPEGVLFKMDNVPRKTGSILCLLALLLPALVLARPAKEGDVVSQFAWQQEVGGFGATLVLSRRPDHFLTLWGAAPEADKRPESLNTPENQNARQAARDEPVVAFILFSDCVPDARGLCNSIVDFEVLQPDGSEFAQLAQADLWKEKDAPQGEGPHLGTTSMGVVVDAEDPLGTYRVQARVCDAVAGRCVDLERSVEFVAPEVALDLDEFLHRYYHDPRPVLVEPAMRALGASGLLAEASARPPIIGFFALVFAENPDFLPRWVPVIQSLEPNTRESLKAAIALSKTPAAVLGKEAPSPFRNDMLWGAFFATGDAQYVHTLVDRMEHLEEREDLNLFLTASSAQWSLSSNARTHPIVVKILQDLHASGDHWRQDIDDALSKSPDELRRAMDEVLRLQEEQGIW